jgi:hypothetical protein
MLAGTMPFYSIYCDFKCVCPAAFSPSLASNTAPLLSSNVLDFEAVADYEIDEI